MNPYEHLTLEQLRIRARLFIEERQALLAEIDRRVNPDSRRTRRGGLRVVDGGRS